MPRMDELTEEENNQYTTDEIADYVCNQLKIETYQAREAMKVALENVVLLDKKNQDYGPFNICGNPHPQMGVAFRAGDKTQRLLNLFLSDDAPNNEGIEDSWQDLSNYGIIGSLLNRNKWLD
jgi:hypothetical protein